MNSRIAALPADSGDETKPSKKDKKKKKKGKQNALKGGEEDLDAILAQLDGPSASKPGKMAWA